MIARAVLRGTSRMVPGSVASKKIKLRMGVRQGEPISSYLFIVAMNFLTE
jgi:hypothetical protein